MLTLRIFSIYSTHLGYGKAEAAERIVAITDAARGALKTLATNEGYPTFSTPEAVHGNIPLWEKDIAIGQCWYASVGIKYMFN